MSLDGIQMKDATKEAHVDIGKIPPFNIPDLPPGMHAYDPESDNLILGVSKGDISSIHAKSMFQKFQNEQGNHDKVYIDGSKINENVGAAAVTKCLFQDE